MSTKIIHLGQPYKQGIQDTLVTIKDLDTGEILDQGPNTILYAGSINAALKDFGMYDEKFAESFYGDKNGYLTTSEIAIPPNYNIALTGQSDLGDGAVMHADGIPCLFAVGIDGVQNSIQSSQRKSVQYESWMQPKDMCAFRVVPNDPKAEGFKIPPTDEEKKKYGLAVSNGSYTSYYFKKFEQKPIMFTQRANSGDKIESANDINTALDANSYYIDKLMTYPEESQVIVQMVCRVTPNEIREWFTLNNQSQNCNVSSIMICTAIPVMKADGTVEYHNIQPKSKRHITRELMLDPEKGLEIIYQYMY